MNRMVSCAVITATAGLLAACERGAAPVTPDTTAAEQEAATNAAKVQLKADARIASARGDVADEERERAHAAAVEGQKVAAEHATDDYKAALARCEDLSDATRQACKDQAGADFHVAKAQAERARVGAEPRP